MEITDVVDLTIDIKDRSAGSNPFKTALILAYEADFLELDSDTTKPIDGYPDEAAQKKALADFKSAIGADLFVKLTSTKLLDTHKICANSKVYRALNKALSVDNKPDGVIIAIGKDVGETVAQTLSRIDELNPDWYTFCLADCNILGATAAKDWVAPKRKLFFAETEEAVDAENTLWLKLKDAPNCCVNYSKKEELALGVRKYLENAVKKEELATIQAKQHSDAAAMVLMLPYFPGSVSMAYKVLNGIIATPLSKPESEKVHKNNGNTYERMAGVSFLFPGTLMNGRFADIAMGTDWVYLTMQNRILSLFVNETKIPYTDTGIAKVELEIRKVLNEAAEGGFLVKESISVSVPQSSSPLLDAARKLRVLSGVSFSGRIAGTINKVIIQGTFSV